MIRRTASSSLLAGIARRPDRLLVHEYRLHLAATVFERPPVDGIARRMIAKRGYPDRVAVVAYSALLMSVTEGKHYATSQMETLLTARKP